MLRLVQVINLSMTLKISLISELFQDRCSKIDSIFVNSNQKPSVIVLVAAALCVINRAVPLHDHLFEVTIRYDLSVRRFRLLKAAGDEIVQISKASSGVITCNYLKFYCNSHLLRDGAQINSNETSSSRFIDFQNVCISSYSFAWGQWND